MNMKLTRCADCKYGWHYSDNIIHCEKFIKDNTDLPYMLMPPNGFCYEGRKSCRDNKNINKASFLERLYDIVLNERKKKNEIS